MAWVTPLPLTRNQALARRTIASTPQPREAETGLYPTVKRFFEREGFVVKGEIASCDLVAIRPGEAPVIVELKRALTLELLLQAADRLAISDRVYLGVPDQAARRFRDSRWRRLLRLLGVGLLAIGRRRVEVLLEPGPYAPRRNRRRHEAILREHGRRAGDPTPGGSTRRPIMTAYRQDALRCAVALARGVAASPAELRREAGVPLAGRILLHNVYGWFERIERGRYGLTDDGHAALRRWGDHLSELGAEAAGDAE